MKILNLGSLNIDHVYDVEDFVAGAETISAKGYGKFIGGKGLNQSIALARAGAEVFHAGAIGEDGEYLKNYLAKANVNVDFINTITAPTGHAIIQVNSLGQNCIIVYGGANTMIEKEDIDAMINTFSKGDMLLLQNETSNLSYAIIKAKNHGMKVALNPSPANKAILGCPLDMVDYFLLNEVEGKYIAGCSEDASFETILDSLAEKFPNAHIILTVGEQGSYYRHKNKRLHQEIFPAKAVDTTAAGDTFSGYFLASLLSNKTVEDALCIASKASSITVGRKGASNSIPHWKEVAESI